MEVTEIIRFKNLPNDVKVVEALISSAYGEFLARNAESNISFIEVKFVGGTPQKEITRELK